VNLEPLVDYLAAQGIGIKGQTLFAQAMPARVKSGVLIVTNSPIEIHPYQRGRLDGTFQVIVRGSRYDQIHDLASRVQNLFYVEGLVLEQMRFQVIRPLHQPLIYPRAEGGQLEASVNFNFTYVDEGVTP